MQIFRVIFSGAVFGLLALLLVSCGQQELLSNVAASTNVISPNADGVSDSIAISYTIGVPAKVTVFVEDQAGQRYALRENLPRVPSSEPYTLVFEGTVPGSEEGIQQRVLPDGTYSWILEATADGGNGTASERGEFTIEQAASTPPTIEDLSVTPEFSPNEDAVDDVAYFSYRLPVSATVSINFSNSQQELIPFISDLPEGPYLQSHIWDGKRPDGSLVPSGTYTYTIMARDEVGNIVEQQGPIAITDPGRSQAQITFSHIAPVEVAFGGMITVTARVKNTGDVAIRTQGPGSGFQYTTNNSFSSVENGQFAEKGGGFWRLGMDWGNGRAYPFRWALSSKPPEEWAEPFQFDYLQPGEEVEITGSVKIEQREDRMQFFVGLVHEGVGYPVNNAGRTLVCVGIPNVESRCPRTAP
jgi:hypothetical protein